MRRPLFEPSARILEQCLPLAEWDALPHDARLPQRVADLTFLLELAVDELVLDRIDIETGDAVLFAQRTVERSLDELDRVRTRVGIRRRASREPESRWSSLRGLLEMWFEYALMCREGEWNDDTAAGFLRWLDDWLETADLDHLAPFGPAILRRRRMRAGRRKARKPRSSKTVKAEP